MCIFVICLSLGINRPLRAHCHAMCGTRCQDYPIFCTFLDWYKARSRISDIPNSSLSLALPLRMLPWVMSSYIEHLHVQKYPYKLNLFQLLPAPGSGSRSMHREKLHLFHEKYCVIRAFIISASGDKHIALAQGQPSARTMSLLAPASSRWIQARRKIFNRTFIWFYPAGFIAKNIACDRTWVAASKIRVTYGVFSVQLQQPQVYLIVWKYPDWDMTHARCHAGQCFIPAIGFIAFRSLILEPWRYNGYRDVVFCYAVSQSSKSWQDPLACSLFVPQHVMLLSGKPKLFFSIPASILMSLNKPFSLYWGGRLLYLLMPISNACLFWLVILFHFHDMVWSLCLQVGFYEKNDDLWCFSCRFSFIWHKYCGKWKICKVKSRYKSLTRRKLMPLPKPLWERGNDPPTRSPSCHWHNFRRE